MSKRLKDVLFVLVVVGILLLLSMLAPSGYQGPVEMP